MYFVLVYAEVVNNVLLKDVEVRVMLIHVRLSPASFSMLCQERFDGAIGMLEFANKKAPKEANSAAFSFLIATRAHILAVIKHISIPR